MYRTWLIPYLEGALSASQRRELETRLADDAALAAELDRLRHKLPRVHDEFKAEPEPTDTAPTPLWPKLRERLADTRPARPPIARAWWIAGAAGLLLLISSGVEQQHLATLGARADAKWLRERAAATQVVFHRDASAQTQMAAKLQARARKVAEERKAVHGRYRRKYYVRPPGKSALP